MNEESFYQFSTVTVLALLAFFYGGTYLLTLLIKKKKENTDAFMVSNHQIGFGLGAASMTATWIWAASFYGAATSGYTYGISGPLHYGLWGALMILFIYPFGRRFRKLAPNAHTLGELIHARHGSSSQLILASSNILGSIISLMVNFTASGALVSVLSPLSFQAGVVIAGVGVLGYTLWSGFRASVLTDFAQLMAMMAVAILIIPAVMFALGGPQTLSDGMSLLTPEQANLFSMDAILNQGAPFFVAVLAYAIGNQTISQRLFAVREDHIKPTFITATIGYGAIVIGLGMIGLMALMTGMEPIGGDMNNLIPQMVSMYLSPVFIALFFILVIGSLSSTADSDLSAMSAIVMADVYGKNIAKNKPDPTKMLFIGRLTMVVATLIGVILASFSMDILIMLVFVGALWGAIVFPVIASCFWDRVTNTAFTSAVIAGLVMFCVARFELLPLVGVVGGLFELLAAVGGGVVLGLMAFGFCGRRVGLVFGTLCAIVLAYFSVGFLRDYTVLLASLIAYGVSTIVCIAVSLMSSSKFDFSQIDQKVINYDPAKPATQA
ncbi:sodium:solute symporter family protein [Vreelandella boliviensis]|uniref:Putative urea active transporter 1 n=1 Tax=Vreelandella boliviensis LC1 TaxID=1072583 RepID=A0A265DX36_9GAMM|nr:sodium:solute symporter family protein [Halomonas boliviensis]EHJ93281.1 putative urea active transporter 1 [Halomonas boliviensis LC1]OZT73883.1 sodium:proline symporter [Halomonas boliviensis LC1]